MNGEQESSGSSKGHFSFSFHGLASVVELGRHKGPLGDILRMYDYMLPAADKCAEQNATYQEKHHDLNRMPLPDPWQYLLNAPAVPLVDKEVFRAAQSQIHALRLLCRMGTGSASRGKDWVAKAIKARMEGNEIAFKRCIPKVLRALTYIETVQDDVRKQNNPELMRRMLEYLKKRRKQLVHRGKTAEAMTRPLPRLEDISKTFPLEYLIIKDWVSFADYPIPGLMFWRNQAITDYISARMGRNPFPNDYIKKARQQLGLIPVSAKAPWVWNVKVQFLKNSNFVIEGRKRNGNTLFK